MKPLLLTFALFTTLTSMSSAGSCLSPREQIRLGKLLTLEAEASEADPDCRLGTGAAACLSPYEQTSKRFFEDKLRSCTGNQTIRITCRILTHDSKIIGEMLLDSDKDISEKFTGDGIIVRLELSGSHLHVNMSRLPTEEEKLLKPNTIAYDAVSSDQVVQTENFSLRLQAKGKLIACFETKKKIN